VRVRVALNHCAHAFAPGRRIRLALATSCWPIAWPAPEPVTLTVLLGGQRASSLELPVRPPRPEDARLPPLGPPAVASPPEVTDLDPGGVQRRVSQLPGGALETLLEVDTQGEEGVALTRYEDIDLTHGHAIRERAVIHPDDPLSAELEIEHRTLTRRGAWSTRVDTRTVLRAERETFLLEAELEARESQSVVRRRSWSVRVPRRLV